MKSKFVFFFPILLSASQVTFASADLPLPSPERVTVSAQRIYTPLGFDSNDNVQVVIHGRLPNTCYKITAPKVTVNELAHEISISPQAFSYSGCRCLDVLVSFTQTVDLGILSAGKYRVMELDGKGRLVQESFIPVSQARSMAPDDYLYAPVKNVRVENGPTGPSVVLNGTFPDTCMEIQEVKVMHTASHLYEVLPIASYKSGTQCDLNPRPFEIKVALPEFEPGESLIYVRSLNGQSVNSVELL
jgi:hypothetical protein